MTICIGFELEGYYRNEDGLINIPPNEYPVDGFPGLIEICGKKSNSVLDAYFDILKQIHEYNYKIDTNTYKHRFTPRELNILRASPRFQKHSLKVYNIYNKYKRSPRYSTTSFQINLSNKQVFSYPKKDGSATFEYFTNFNWLQIIKNLDDAFSEEIKATSRTPGDYAFKRNRIEYRSLPSTVFKHSLNDCTKVINIIKECLKD